jgi:imidazole glycerol-phosphate synthase subunit HisH
MGRCMEALRTADLLEPTREALQSGRPFLGVCVGMQMLHAGSTEHGGVEGLGFFSAMVERISAVGPEGRPIKVPHMQWNRLRSVRPSRLLAGSTIDGEPWVYFVHSYAAAEHPDVVATTDYGSSITALVERGSVFGTQFHPEKSGEHGLSLLHAFARLCADDQVELRVL